MLMYTLRAFHRCSQHRMHSLPCRSCASLLLQPAAGAPWAAVGSTRSCSLHTSRHLPCRTSNSSSSSSSDSSSSRNTLDSNILPALSQSVSTASTYVSEHVTRTVLGCSSAMMLTGVAPSGVRAFCSTAFSNSSDQASLSTSQRVDLGPVPGWQAELLSDALLGFGAQSVVVEEYRGEGQQEQERFGAEAELWDNCRLLVHFAIEDDVAAVLQTVREACDLPDLQYSVGKVEDQEYVAQIKASYVPVQVTEGLWIIPDWSEPVDLAATNIILTPGVAFGTGEHPTTKLCLQLLMQRTSSVAGATVMDYGTGSGVLAIAALLLGAKSAVGTDTDPLAVRASAANATLNSVESQMQLVQCGANLSDPDPILQVPTVPSQFDLVMANILRGPLLELQPRLTGYCKPGGRLVLSGILQEQVPDVKAAYGPYFDGFEVSTEGSWAFVTAVRSADHQ